MTQVSLRNLRHAQTKKDILHSFLKMLCVYKKDDITAVELAKNAGVSRATFFNYFSSTGEVMKYFIQLWNIEALYESNKVLKSGSFKDAIHSVFQITVKRMEQGGAPLVRETVAYILQQRSPLIFENLKKEEYQLFFPEKEGVEEYKAEGFNPLIANILKDAVETKQLITDLTIEDMTMLIRSVFFGVPVAVRGDDVGQVKKLYMTQMEMLWKQIADSS